MLPCSLPLHVTVHTVIPAWSQHVCVA